MSRLRRTAALVGPLGTGSLLAAALALVTWTLLLGAREAQAPLGAAPFVAASAPELAPIAPDAPLAIEAIGEDTPAPPSEREVAEAPPITRALPPGRYECRQPRDAMRLQPACLNGLDYPYCRAYLPQPRRAAPYRIWRNTEDGHRWARPGLVSLVLAAARDYAARWPGERLVVGDLDAPGPRHATHRDGVDADLYLPHAMIVRSLGNRTYAENYADKTPDEVAALRARVLDLAKILATCAQGNLRIYYNDEVVEGEFLSWFRERGLRSEVGRAMEPHNELHRFHFHVTVAPDLSPLPEAPR